MRYKCVLPCRLRYCAGSRTDDVDLKMAFRQLPKEELLRRIETLPPDLRSKALNIQRAAWIA